MTPRGAPSPSADEPFEMTIGDRTVRITHPDRILWPLSGTTKRELIDYLLAVAPVMLPHLQARPTMLWRFPEGVDRPGWFQAQCRSRPDWVPTYAIIGKRGDTLRYCRIEEAATLAWLANLGTIEFHPHDWTVDRPPRPSALIFDLDPGPPAGLAEAAAVAIAIRERLSRVGLEAVAKTSGWSGLHVAAPLAEGETFEHAKAFSRGLAEDLAELMPGAVVATSDRAGRRGRIYVDWIQNDPGRQLIAPYSPRATPRPTVSTPLMWAEVEVAAKGDTRALRPGFREVLDRIDRHGDLWTIASGTTARLPSGRN